MTDWLNEALRCPKTGQRLVRDGDFLRTEATPGFRYPVRSGVPILLPDEAEELPAV